MSKKGDLLEHYAGREPTQFVQYDGFAKNQADGIFNPDKDGDTLFSGDTWELMGGAGVRLLIDPELGRADILRLLAKISKQIKREWVKTPTGEQSGHRREDTPPF